jgi:glutamyl-tRNA synthetase
MASASVTNSASSDRNTAVVTRFAPSPTGFLHIGGARTALFNWLFARHHGGTYLLRIEDTDRARSTEPAIAAIFDGLSWLGLDGDEPPVFQFARSERHAKVAHRLLAAGHAYRCYLTQEELAERRAAAQAERRPFRIDSEWRDADPATWPADLPYVIRVKAPREGETVIHDLVQGPITVNNREIDDFVILRGDGTPTYMLAVVVDDHDMGVTHVIRGDDHINNAFRQLVVIRAMHTIEQAEGTGAWPDPAYAHIPLIHGADGAKLSKRHGALGVDAYRDELGLLPEAVVNYLLRLGWGHEDEEFIDRDQAVAWFDIADVNKGAARFDLKKLLNLNGHYIRQADDTRLAGEVAKRLGLADAATLALLTTAMPVLKVRAADLNELAEGARFLFAVRPITADDKAAALLTDEARALLGQALGVLSAAPAWTAEALEASIKALAANLGLGLGKLAQPLRAALTGQTTSPGIYDVLFLLGRDEALARIGDQCIGDQRTGAVTG